MLSYVGPPVVAAFMLGLFWKRANGTGIFTGLLSTIAIALFMTSYGLKHTFPGSMYFLYMAPVNFVFSMAIMVFVSLLTTKPLKEKTEDYTLTIEFFKEESASFKKVIWYSDFRLWAVLLVVQNYSAELNAC